MRLPPLGLIGRASSFSGRVTIRLLGSTDASPVDDTSSAFVVFRTSLARLISSDVSQCTDRRIPPFCSRPSYLFASNSGIPMPIRAPVTPPTAPPTPSPASPAMIGPAVMGQPRQTRLSHGSVLVLYSRNRVFLSQNSGNSCIPPCNKLPYAPQGAGESATYSLDSPPPCRGQSPPSPF